LAEYVDLVESGIIDPTNVPPVTVGRDDHHRHMPEKILKVRREHTRSSMYHVLRKLENEDSVHVACRGEFEEAVELLQGLKDLWPGHYLIKFSGPVGSVLEQKSIEVCNVAPEQNVYQAIEIMAQKGIGALLVMDAGKLVGIVSERDYARKVILQGKSSKTTPVKEIMTNPVVFVAPDVAVDECLAIMTKKRIRHLPVMKNGSVVAVVSIGDLVKWLVVRQEETMERLQEYILEKLPS
jgi:CBS domain-containing protein